jgi:hypothetical protein
MIRVTCPLESYRNLDQRVFDTMGKKRNVARGLTGFKVPPKNQTTYEGTIPKDPNPPKILINQRSQICCIYR